MTDQSSSPTEEVKSFLERVLDYGKSALDYGKSAYAEAKDKVVDHPIATSAGVIVLAALVVTGVVLYKNWNKSGAKEEAKDENLQQGVIVDEEEEVTQS